MYTKNFTYKGFTALMTVQLNTLVDRTPNGKRIHTLNVSCEKGSESKNNYTQSRQVEDSELSKAIYQEEQNFQKWVDGGKTETETLLEGMGFVCKE